VNQDFALAIGGEVLALDALTRPALEALGARIGLGKVVVGRAFRDLTSRARQSGKWLPQAADAGRDAFGARYAEIVRNQCAKILES
jgi:hypothetical protein